MNPFVKAPKLKPKLNNSNNNQGAASFSLISPSNPLGLASVAAAMLKKSVE